MTFTGALNTKGTFKTTLPDKSKVSIKISSKTGATRITITNGTFATALNSKAFVSGTNTRKGVGVVLADAVIATEVLDLATKVSGSRFNLNYRFGSQGKDAGGTFQIVSLRGKDANTFAAADTFRVGFLAMAATGLTAGTGQTNGLNGATSITTRIGTSFTQTLTPSVQQHHGLPFQRQQGWFHQELLVEQQVRQRQAGHRCALRQHHADSRSRELADGGQHLLSAGSRRESWKQSAVHRRTRAAHIRVEEHVHRFAEPLSS